MAGIVQTEGCEYGASRIQGVLRRCRETSHAVTYRIFELLFTPDDCLNDLSPTRLLLVLKLTGAAEHRVQVHVSGNSTVWAVHVSAQILITERRQYRWQSWRFKERNTDLL